MRTHSRRPSELALGALLLSASGMWAAEAPTGLGCIQESLLPGYGNIARRAKQPGSVTAQVKIGDGGTLAWLDLQAPDKFLAQEVEVFLRYNTRFRADCRGQQITVVYTFVLRGDPVTGPNVRVTFRGPNEFVLESQPQLPIVDVMPAQASGPDPKGVDKKKK